MVKKRLVCAAGVFLPSAKKAKRLGFCMMCRRLSCKVQPESKDNRGWIKIKAEKGAKDA
jgi:hypothetical protein